MYIEYNRPTFEELENRYVKIHNGTKGYNKGFFERICLMRFIYIAGQKYLLIIYIELNCTTNIKEGKIKLLFWRG